MKNVIYVNFIDREVETNLIAEKRNEIKKIEKLIEQSLTLNQRKKYNLGYTSYNKARILNKISKSKKLKTYATEIIDLCFEIEKLKNNLRGENCV